MSQDPHHSIRPTWILTAVLVLLPVGVSLAAALPLTTRVDPDRVAPTPMLFDAIASSALLPSALLATLLVPLVMLPSAYIRNALLRRTALTLGVLLSILSLAAATLGPLYAYMRALSTCYSYMGMFVFFVPASWVYYVSGLSDVLTVVVIARVFDSLRAA